MNLQKYRYLSGNYLIPKCAELEKHGLKMAEPYVEHDCISGVISNGCPKAFS